MESLLKDCPFCGGEPERISTGGCGQNTWRKKEYGIRCKCGIETPWFERESSAVKFWNRRVEVK